MAANKVTFYGSVKNGMLWDAPELVKGFLDSENMQGVKVEVIIQPASQDTTSKQWQYLYGSVYKHFAEYSGHSISEVDALMKQLFRKDQEIVLPEGYELTKTAFSRYRLVEYTDFCIQTAAAHGVFVPPANPEWRELAEKEKEDEVVEKDKPEHEADNF